MFKNKTLLITGGTGSFGNAVLDRFLKSELNPNDKEFLELDAVKAKFLILKYIEDENTFWEVRT